MDRDDPAYAGQAHYSRPLLRVYDPLVLGLQARFTWRCPSSRLIANYRDHIGRRHLDVGPGTGFFVERAGLPDGSPVVLLDPNVNVLAHAGRRLAHLDVTAVEADVLKPVPVAGPFNSAALNMVLHCLPGPTEAKAVAIRHVADTLTPDGVLFGASMLGRSASHTWLAPGRSTTSTTRPTGFARSSRPRSRRSNWMSSARPRCSPPARRDHDLPSR